MKIPSNDLHRLVKSLTAAELRLFKKENDPNSLTMELFDLLCELEVYDEEQIKKRLSNASFAKNLKVHKNRLQHLILEQLRAQQTQGIAQEIRKQIQNIELYIQKQLYDLAYDQIHKTKKFCEEYEDYEYLLVVLGIEARQSTYFREFEGTITKTPAQQMLDCMAIIENYVQLAQINKDMLNAYDLFKTRMEQGMTTEHDVQSIFQRELLDAKIQPLSPIADRLYLHCFAIYHLTERAYEKAYQASRKILEAFDRNPNVRQQKYTQYFNCMLNHLPHCGETERYEELDLWFERSKELASVYPHLQPMLLYGYTFCLESFRRIGHYPRMIVLVETEVLPLVDKFELKGTWTALSLFLMMVMPCMAEGRMDLAGRFLVEVLQDKTQNGPVLFWIANVLELIYHIQQNDWLLLENFANAHIKRLRRNQPEQHFKVIEQILLFCKRFAASGKDQAQKLIQKHREELSNQWDSPFMLAFCRFFDYALWLQCLPQKESFSEELRKKRRLSS